MRKIVLLSALLVLSFNIISAQDYKTGIGIRAGYYNGFTIKHFIKSSKAIEGIIDTRWHGIDLTGLYEIHHSFIDIEGLNWYYGIGGHAGFYNGDYYPYGTSGTAMNTLGVDLILALEYNFRAIPLNLSLDWKPAINVVGDTRFWGDGGAFSVRFIF
jgi:hypothetical protein